MTDIHKLLRQLADEEQDFMKVCFLAPCTRGGRARVRIASMVYTFSPKPSHFYGWGIFQPVGTAEARVTERADFVQVAEYLQQMPQKMRFWLARPLQYRSWLAYPVNVSDARQRLGVARPAVIHLVEDGARFEPVVARGDGSSWWFEDIDRRADPMPTEALQQALEAQRLPEEVKFKGMTPEMRATYELSVAWKHLKERWQEQRTEKQLRDALQLGGGDLQRYRDRNDYWLVEWTTATGERHSSAIAKNDLTVVSAGICLSGGDRAFDLQSLVGVIEQRADE